jgi:hypothetical protein
MSPDAPSPVDLKKTEKSSRSKTKSAIRMLPLLITALVFGYWQVTEELEKKDQQREEYAIQAAVRETVIKTERQRRLMDLSFALSEDIAAAFAEPRDDGAFNRILFAATEDSAVYIETVNRMLKSGGHKTALQAALLYCREIDASRENNKKDIFSMGACLEKFGFQTTVTGDSLTISGSGEKPERASARPAQEN